MGKRFEKGVLGAERPLSKVPEEGKHRDSCECYCTLEFDPKVLGKVEW